MSIIPYSLSLWAEIEPEVWKDIRVDFDKEAPGEDDIEMNTL